MSREQAIDTHVHFWQIADYQPYAAWFGEKKFLRRDYLPTDLERVLPSCNVASAIIVGAAPDSPEQNQWYGELAQSHDSVCAVVGSYTFDNPQLAEQLDRFAEQAWFVGIRARPTAPPDQWLADLNARRGVQLLRQRNLVLDILVDHTLLPAVASFAAHHADLPFVLNHCGLPPFRSGDLTDWATQMQALAPLPNLFVKYSSFFLHCHPHCDRALLQQAGELLFTTFGPSRLIWGSNWPPELIGGTYAEAHATMLAAAGQLSDHEYNLVFRRNAQRVYGLALD